MSLIVESSGGSFKPVPAGMHLARCYRIIDLGTQKSEYEGKVNFLHKVKFVWEVHGEEEDGTPLVTDKGEPMIITKDYTLSWGEKANLRKDLVSWRGRPFTEEEQRRFDLKQVLDKWCMLNVTHKPKKDGNGVYANVVAVNPVPAAIKSSIPDGFNKVGMFTLNSPDMEMFDTFSDYLKKTIMASPEWQSMLKADKQLAEQGIKKPSDGGFDDMDDDLPF